MSVAQPLGSLGFPHSCPSKRSQRPSTWRGAALHHHCCCVFFFLSPTGICIDMHRHLRAQLLLSDVVGFLFPHLPLIVREELPRTFLNVGIRHNSLEKPNNSLAWDGLGVPRHCGPRTPITNCLSGSQSRERPARVAQMSNLGNSTSQKRTLANLGRLHGLPYVCAKMVCGRFG